MAKVLSDRFLEVPHIRKSRMCGAPGLAAEPAIPVQFYLEIGLLESASIPSRDPSMLTANRHLRDVLMAKGNRVHCVEHYSGHEHLSWRATIADALIDTLAPQ